MDECSLKKELAWRGNRALNGDSVSIYADLTLFKHV